MSKEDFQKNMKNIFENSEKHPEELKYSMFLDRKDIKPEELLSMKMIQSKYKLLNDFLKHFSKNIFQHTGNEIQDALTLDVIKDVSNYISRNVQMCENILEKNNVSGYLNEVFAQLAVEAKNNNGVASMPADLIAITEHIENTKKLNKILGLSATSIPKEEDIPAKEKKVKEEVKKESKLVDLNMDSFMSGSSIGGLNNSRKKLSLSPENFQDLDQIIELFKQRVLLSSSHTEIKELKDIVSGLEGLKTLGMKQQNGEEIDPLLALEVLSQLVNIADYL